MGELTHARAPRAHAFGTQHPRSLHAPPSRTAWGDRPVPVTCSADLRTGLRSIVAQCPGAAELRPWHIDCSLPVAEVPHMSFRRASGFTLVESLVVLSVLGILFTIALPAYQHYNGGLALRRSSERVLGELRRARQTAASEHNDVIVTFSAYSGVMQIHDDDNNDGVIGGNELVRQVAIVEGTAFYDLAIAPSDSLVFTLLGTLRDRNGGGYLVIQGCDGDADTLHVSAVGHISRS
jgi:type IV fimbrial biogenesis protein FimT